MTYFDIINQLDHKAILELEYFDNGLQQILEFVIREQDYIIDLGGEGYHYLVKDSYVIGKFDNLERLTEVREGIMTTHLVFSNAGVGIMDILLETKEYEYRKDFLHFEEV